VKLYSSKTIRALLLTASIGGGLSLAYAQQEPRGATSYLPVDIKESFASIMARMKAAKALAGARSRQAAHRRNLGPAGVDEPWGDP
jgi:hypothetical protein